MTVSNYFRKVALKVREQLLHVLKPEADPYKANMTFEQVSENAYKFAKEARGVNRKRALMIYGVMPRCGTNFVGPLVALHPDICPWPNRIYEVPFLRLTNHILDFEKEYFRDYKLNEENMGKNDFLTMFGASFIGYMHTFISDDTKKMLLKEPDVRYLSYFPLVFPNEDLLLLLRDGRDVVYSTIKSWPSWSFEEACYRWDQSAQLMLKFDLQHIDNPSYWMVKYEDVLLNPESFVKEACERYSLDSKIFPYEKINDMKIVGSSTESRKDGNVDWSQQVERSKKFQPTGRWQKWSSDEKNKFKKIAGQTLIDAGYCEDLNW